QDGTKGGRRGKHRVRSRLHSKPRVAGGSDHSPDIYLRTVRRALPSTCPVSVLSGWQPAPYDRRAAGPQQTPAGIASSSKTTTAPFAVVVSRATPRRVVRLCQAL